VIELVGVGGGEQFKSIAHHVTVESLEQATEGQVMGRDEA